MYLEDYLSRIYSKINGNKLNTESINKYIKINNLLIKMFLLPSNKLHNNLRRITKFYNIKQIGGTAAEDVKKSLETISTITEQVSKLNELMSGINQHKFEDNISTLKQSIEELLKVLKSLE
jgi:hypothetical protein